LRYQLSLLTWSVAIELLTSKTPCVWLIDAFNTLRLAIGCKYVFYIIHSYFLYCVMKPTLRQLQYLVALKETQSFSAAARKCHVSQPSLSTQIADMEAVLDVTLIERGRGRAQLTPIGQDVAAQAQRVLAAMRELRMSARDAGSTFRGNISLGTLPSVGPYLLPSVLRKLHAQFPELRIAVREESTNALRDGLASGRLDVIISTPESHPDTRSTPLFTEHLHIGVATDDALASGSGPVTLEDLKGRQVLTLGQSHRLGILIRDMAEQAGAVVDDQYTGTSLDAIRQMAEMGERVAILPSLYVVSEAQDDPGLYIRRISNPIAQRDIALLWRPTSPLAEKFRTIAEIMNDEAKAILSRIAEA
jgi:LysR family hydrogen peroxide-inducible transcriptional activator